MGKKGFYGREYIRTKDGDYDYQAQVNRLHNLKEWDRDETLVIKEGSEVSLDEMNERWKAYDWLVADDKHWESKIIRKVDELAYQKRRDARRLLPSERKMLYSEPIDVNIISKFIH
ncbi:MAG: hypothetical protein MJZ37_00065 [Bacilli bacterium]|nr:hypothetical protein [Bacilli bacterium]